MPGQHPRKFLSDGSANPAWRPRASGRSGRGGRKPRKDEPGWKPRTSGKKKRLIDDAVFIAWDGEGINTGVRLESYPNGVGELVDVMDDIAARDRQRERRRAWLDFRREVFKKGQGIGFDADYVNLPPGLQRTYGMEPDLLADEMGFEDANALASRAWDTYNRWQEVKDWRPAEPPENVTVQTHKYVLLMNSEGEQLIREHGISTLDALRMLTDSAKIHERAIHVCFGMSYDANMMLGDLPRDDIALLWKGLSVNYAGYEIEYRARKQLTIRKWARQRWAPDEKIPGGKRPNFEVSVVLWDVFGFFQSSFLVAVERWLGSDYKDLSLIKKGKARRSQFQASELAEEVVPYTRAEVRALVNLMNQLRENLLAADLPVRRWDGAGAVAAALLRRESLKEHLAVTPDDVAQAAKIAYAGGRIEILQYGDHQGRIHHWDINSAYPAAMLDLPSLAGGTWELTHPFSPVELPSFTLYHVTWEFDDDRPLYPFFFRSPHGRITFPREGEGWYWGPEVLAAWDWNHDDFVINEAWTFAPATERKPFDFLPPLYALRKQWKKERNRAEKVLKLGYNSLYGKLAQHLGGANGFAPPFKQLEYAGFITSRTRARLFAAAAQAPESVVMLATDGIYALEKLSLPCSDELGDWDYKEHEGLTVVQSGVYWTHESAESKDECDDPACLRDGARHLHEYRRGFDKGSITQRSVVRAWQEERHAMESRATRFVTMGAALAGQKSWLDWRCWKSAPRMLRLDAKGTKREDVNHGSPWHPDRDFVRTLPALNLAASMMSAPYEPRFGISKIDDVAEDIFEVECAESEI